MLNLSLLHTEVYKCTEGLSCLVKLVDLWKLFWQEVVWPKFQKLKTSFTAFFKTVELKEFLAIFSNLKLNENELTLCSESFSVITV